MRKEEMQAHKYQIGLANCGKFH